MKVQKHFVSTLIVMPLMAAAQVARERDVAPLKPWAAPLYWQPTVAEAPLAQSPAGSLVFVGMTPCRVVDTRIGQGFGGAFGPPSLTQGENRTFPIQSSTTCTIPSIAQAYSFNVTVVPQGFLGFVTVYPTGAVRPTASTINDNQGVIIANAAIVPAGTSGSVDVFANNPTDLIIDINGYYAPQSGITLAQGTAGAPSLSFANDSGTGIFSSAMGTLNLATGGTNRLTVRPDGDLDIPGSVRKGGTLFLHNLGTDSTSVGLGSLAGSASGNTAVGRLVLPGNTTGNDNTGVGSGALFSNTGGSYNVAVGSQALNTNSFGFDNVAFGRRALLSNTASDNNTAVGSNALLNATGANNIAIGYQAGSSLTTGAGNIIIGTVGGSTDTNTIRLGDTSPTGQSSAFIGGIFGRTVLAGNGATNVLIDSTGQLGTVLSSRRYKEDIHDMGDSSTGLLRLRPVTFRYRQPYADGSKPLDYGLIAEEVAETYPDLVVRGTEGQVETVQYHKLTPMLLNEVQKQNRQLQRQDETIRELKEANRSLQNQISTLQQAVDLLGSGKSEGGHGRPANF